MRLISITCACEKEITGMNDIVHVEFKANSFSEEDDQIMFKRFFQENNKECSRVFINGFEKFNAESLKGTITLYRIRKRLKQLDIHRHTPHHLGVEFVISEKAMNIIERFPIPEINKIPVHIEGFEGNYYLVGFPCTRLEEEVDFSRSTFYSLIKKEIMSFKDFEDYTHKKSSEILALVPDELFIKNKYSYHILNLGDIYGVVFSEELYQALIDEECIGFVTYRTEFYTI